MAHWNMLAGWVGMTCGLTSGAVIGLFFHRDLFAGGYGDFRRRMLRLGHIAFFGLGIINVVFSLTLTAGTVSIDYPAIASLGLIVGALLMPMICFLTAWKDSFRHIFALPVVCVAVAFALLLNGLVAP
jgi:hypothetical protein